MIRALSKWFKPVKPVRKTRLWLEGFEERSLPAVLVDLAVAGSDGGLSRSAPSGVTNAIFIDDGSTDTSVDIRNGPGGDDFTLGSGVRTMDGPLFGYEYPWSANARWTWSGNMVGDGTEYALGTVVKGGAGIAVGVSDSVSPVPLGNPPNPFFRDSQRFAGGRLIGNVIGIGIGMEMTAAGMATLSGAGMAEIASVGLATPVAAHAAAIGVIEIGGGVYMMANGGYRFIDNVRHFPDGGGGGGGGGSSLPPKAGDANLKGAVEASGMKGKQAGEFFGWEPSKVTKGASDFTKEQLLANGWTKQKLLDAAAAYDQVTKITPANPSAAGRAEQLRQLAKLFD